MSRKIHSGDTNHHQDRDVEERRRQREAVLGHIGLFGQWLAGRFAGRLSQGYLWHSTKKFSAGVPAGRAGAARGRRAGGRCLCTSKAMEGAPVISRPAICLANSWRTITKMSRDYLPLAQWCNVDDPHMLARNITMVHSGLKPFNAKKTTLYMAFLSAMHTFKLCMECLGGMHSNLMSRQFEILVSAICKVQSLISFEANYRVYDNIL